MPWQTPTLSEVRSQVRDLIRGALPGADANVPNSVLRVLSDNQGALCHLTLQYIDWLALQLMPDTAETEWLDRHAYIWLVNADGSTGRKLATFAVGTATFVGPPAGAVVPQATQLDYGGVAYETLAQAIATDQSTPIPIRALDPGTIGNLDPGTQLQFTNGPPPQINGSATVETLQGGTDQETDDELRARVLERIQQPPMGGDQEDYVHWALMVPGVTRAWCYPLEMGIGTVTVRFMCDDLRAVENDGFPLEEDIETVTEFIDRMRPVTVKDFFVEAPLRFPINFKIINLATDDESTRAAIEQSVDAMFMERVMPGQEIYRSWISEAISQAPGVDHFDLEYENTSMPSNGYMPIVGTISYG
jgi:uncharacterized phage protein gp47/JayE